MATQPRTTAQRAAGLFNAVINVLLLLFVVSVLFLLWPWIIVQLRSGTGTPQDTATPIPTLTNVQRYNDQLAAPATSQEQNLPALQPTVQAAQPIAPAAPMSPAQPTIQPAQYSPIDLGAAPIPTPTSGISQEQLDASAASEEQNQLNTAQSGRTYAQQLVDQHSAEQNARNP